MRSFCILLFTVMAIVNLPGIKSQSLIPRRPCPTENCKPKDVPSECSSPLDGYEPCPGVNEVCCVLPESRRVDENACASQGGECYSPPDECSPIPETDDYCPSGEKCCLGDDAVADEE